jgi:hypothetical protein
MIDHANHDSILSGMMSAHNVTLADIANVMLTTFATYVTI